MKDSDDKSTIPKVIHPSISPRSASSTLNIIKVGIDKLYVYVISKNAIILANKIPLLNLFNL